MKVPAVVAAVGFFVGLGACASTEPPRQSARPLGPAPGVATAPKPTTPPPPAVAAQRGPPDTAPIYFAYDSALFDASTTETRRLQDLGEYLRATPRARLLVEGHADERGTSEYNLALGDRRARAVFDYLRRLGVPDTQLSLVSYGEERPAAAGGGEAAWQMNRRDELKLAPPPTG